MKQSQTFTSGDSTSPAPLVAAQAWARRRIDDDRRRYPEDFGPVFEALVEGLFGPSFRTEAVVPDPATAHRFRLLVGMTPRAYRDRQRLRTAIELVCGSTLPMAEIAPGLGFDDLVAFRKWFRWRTGVAPTKMRGSDHEEADPESTDPGGTTTADADVDRPWTLREIRRALVGGVTVERGRALIRAIRAAYPELEDATPAE